MNNRSAIETIKSKLPIESVVGSYIKLDKLGTKWKACCPFHTEKTPSFQVDPDKGFYYCFGCHKGGDIFSFVQEIEGLDFNEAKKMLAERAGVPLEEYKTDKPNRTTILREIMDSAAKFYEVGLRTNKEVVDYLLSRGMTKQTMIDWRVGYAVKGWGNLYEFLKKKYSDTDILATGLCLKSDRGGGLYDRFRERIMFPIADNQGRIVAFTGRVMPGTEESTKSVGKYINSPETDLYHKSTILYGFDKAKTAIHQAGFAIIVEGQMDCVMAHQAGTKQVVALSGTACTDEQITQLSRFTNEVVLCLDDDAAGLAASQKSTMVAYRHELKVAVIGIESGKDPADMVRENPELWINVIAQKKDFITFRLDKMKQKNQEGNKLQIVQKELFPILEQMQFQMSIDEKLQEIAQSLNVSADSIRKDFERFAKTTSSAPKSVSVPLKPLIPRENQKEGLLGNMIGIMIAIGSGDLFEKLKQDFAAINQDYAMIIIDFPTDKQAKYGAEIEASLGPVASHEPEYERMFHQYHTRYKLILLDEEKHILDTTLHTDPNNMDALAKLDTISKEKDRLIHKLSNF